MCKYEYREISCVLFKYLMTKISKFGYTITPDLTAVKFSRTEQFHYLKEGTELNINFLYIDTSSFAWFRLYFFRDLKGVETHRKQSRYSTEVYEKRISVM